MQASTRYTVTYANVLKLPDAERNSFGNGIPYVIPFPVAYCDSFTDRASESDYNTFSKRLADVVAKPDYQSDPDDELHACTFGVRMAGCNQYGYYR
jgi:hypothetical protein